MKMFSRFGGRNPAEKFLKIFFWKSCGEISRRKFLEIFPGENRRKILAGIFMKIFFAGISENIFARKFSEKFRCETFAEKILRRNSCVEIRGEISRKNPGEISTEIFVGEIPENIF